MLLSVHGISVLFLVRFNNFRLLLELHALTRVTTFMHSCCKLEEKKWGWVISQLVFGVYMYSYTDLESILP